MSDVTPTTPALPPQIYVPVPGVRSGRITLLEGPSGVGKTWQARSLVEGGLNVLYASAENKWGSLKDMVDDGRMKVWPIKDFDFPLNGEEKAAIQARSEGYSLIDIFDYLRAGDHPFDVVYHDSFMRYLWKMLEYLFTVVVNEKDKKDTRAAYGVFARKAKMLFDRMATLTDAAVSKRPVHYIGTWGVEKDVDFKGRRMDMPIVDGQQIRHAVNYFWDDVLHLRCEEGGERVVYTTGTHEFDAKVSSVAQIPPVLKNFNLYRFIQVADGVEGK
jgi:hypothetical protein